MRCTRCQALMFATETLREGRAEQPRYQCPICNGSRLQSRCLPVAEICMTGSPLARVSGKGRFPGI